MTQLSFSLNSSLLVRDVDGHYSPATVDQILEAARYAIDKKMTRGTAFTSPCLVKEFLIAKLAGCEQEVFAVLFLDSQHRLIQYSEMFYGTIDGAAVYPREVVKAAMSYNAAAIIMSHNHPSGTPDPSTADKKITQRLKSALELVDVRVLDHVIVGGDDTFSFAEYGLL